MIYKQLIFRIILAPQMHKVASLATNNFKIFRESIPLPPPFLACSFGRIRPRFKLCRLLCFIGLM